MCPLGGHQQQCQRSLCLHRWANFYFRVFIEHHYGCNNFFVDYSLEILAPSSLCVWSQIPWRTQQIRCGLEVFARTSKIGRIVRICVNVNWFLWKPFWFFLRIFSISDSMQLRSRASRASFLYLIFTTSNYTWVKSPRLMSSWFFNIFCDRLICNIQRFQSRFLKCSFPMCAIYFLFFWLSAFSLALEALFLLLTHLLFSTQYEIVNLLRNF